jgi:hypothetical protein
MRKALGSAWRGLVAAKSDEALQSFGKRELDGVRTRLTEGTETAKRVAVRNGAKIHPRVSAVKADRSA